MGLGGAAGFNSNNGAAQFDDDDEDDPEHVQAMRGIRMPSGININLLY